LGGIIGLGVRALGVHRPPTPPPPGVRIRLGVMTSGHCIRSAPSALGVIIGLGVRALGVIILPAPPPPGVIIVLAVIGLGVAPVGPGRQNAGTVGVARGVPLGPG
jgi:hypothetical protein